MTTKDFKLPDLGEGVHEGQIVRVMVTPGMVVREEQPLMEVETDKAAVVIPCPFAGTVEKVHVRDGQMVHVGEVMVTIDESRAGARSEAGAATSVARVSPSLEGGGEGVGGAHDIRGVQDSRLTHSPTSVGKMAPPNNRTHGDAARSTLTPALSLSGRGSPAASPRSIGTATRHTPASPAVRKLARTLNLDIETIRGSGPGGRVQRADVEKAGNQVPAPQKSERPTLTPALSLQGRGSRTAAAPPIAARVAHAPLPESQVTEPPDVGEDASDAHGPIRIAPLTQARKTIARVMTQAWTTIPHATDCDDADVTELDKLRRGYTPPDGSDRKITMLAFVVRAVVRALQRF